MKKIPQYKEMVPGRLNGKVTGLCKYILEACPLLQHSLIYGFLFDRKKMRHREYDLRWWLRIEAALMDGFSRKNP